MNAPPGFMRVRPKPWKVNDFAHRGFKATLLRVLPSKIMQSIAQPGTTNSAGTRFTRVAGLSILSARRRA